MKIVNLMIPLLMAIGYAQAQEYKLNTRYPGYFINAKGDTIRGYILLINKLDNQRGGQYSNDAKGEKINIHLLPYQVRGFKAGNRVYTSVEHGEADPTPEHFLLTLQEGQLDLYEYFSIPDNFYIGEGTGRRPATGDDEAYLQSEFVVITAAGKKIVVTNQNELTKNAAHLFEGSPGLISKVKEKEKGYRYNDLPEIVRSYNESKNP
jgi:hypothetical protein